MKTKFETRKPEAATVTQRYATGKALRSEVPRESHAGFKPHPKRPGVVAMLEESSKGRIPQLIPIRYGRMMQSPFTFFRGAAGIMAEDLSRTPATGVHVQACGDCHLLNFGMFATPERRLIFDINDFDETLPAPWEWDLKRLAASFVVAARNNGIANSACRRIAATLVQAYRKSMSKLSGMKALDVWYSSIDEQTILGTMPSEMAKRKLLKQIEEARRRSIAEHDFPKLTTVEGGRVVIKDNPPLIFHAQVEHREEQHKNITTALKQYRESIPDDRRVLFDRFRLIDVALKVVGVGSVGTWCGIALFMAADDDPLLLQVKEARRSVLEPYAGKSIYPHRGQRVVVGQRLMQSASDIFLGWCEGTDGIHRYVRQLRDWKVKVLVESMEEQGLVTYSRFCGWSLARAHARSGDSVMLSGYMGKSNVFDQAIADFAMAYAIQNEKDHAALLKAVRARKIEVNMER